MKVAFQGTHGAYSEVALKKFYGEDVESRGFKLSEEVFEAVLAGEVDQAILPVENSIIGNVAINSDLLYQKDLQIIGEAYLVIHHCLLSLPGTKLEEIKEVESHPVALEQCRQFLNRHHMTPLPGFDTAGAAKELSKLRQKNKAVISSSLCSQMYGLEILQEKIQNTRLNQTRFLVFVKEENVPKDIKREKVSLAFEAGHQPGSLLRCLQIFAAHSLNLTKLESRPDQENPFQYRFFVDFSGDLTAENVKAAMVSLGHIAKSVKIFGNFPNGEIFS